MRSVKFLLTFILIICWSCSIPRIIFIQDPLTPEEHVKLGLAYENKGEYQAAIKEYLEASQKLDIAYLYLGNAQFQAGDYDSAEKSYRESISRNSQEADAYNNLAWLYLTQRKNLAEAERLASEALRINPSKENIYRDTLDKIRTISIR